MKKTRPILRTDPAAITRPLDQLGWVAREAGEFTQLRDELEAHNGLQGLEIVAPDAIEDAVRIFYRDGFVVIENVLDTDQLAHLREGTFGSIRAMLALDKDRVGNRGSHRYSFGAASLTGHMVHHPAWAMLIDLPRLTPVLTALFDSPDYITRGGGGDFCLPGATFYQPLHSDIVDRFVHKGTTFGSFYDPTGGLTIRDLPCPYICCNFLITDFTHSNGPTRQIPGSQHSRAPLPTLAEEPAWMKHSTVSPAKAGSVLIRDVRAWHGGTPNVSGEIRAIPNIEYYAPWFREPLRTCMPRKIYETLSDHGKRLAKFIVADENELLQTGFRSDLGGTPALLRT